MDIVGNKTQAIHPGGTQLTSPNVGIDESVRQPQSFLGLVLLWGFVVCWVILFCLALWQSAWSAPTEPFWDLGIALALIALYIVDLGLIFVIGIVWIITLLRSRYKQPALIYLLLLLSIIFLPISTIGSNQDNSATSTILIGWVVFGLIWIGYAVKIRGLIRNGKKLLGAALGLFWVIAGVPIAALLLRTLYFWYIGSYPI